MEVGVGPLGGGEGERGRALQDEQDKGKDVKDERRGSGIRGEVAKMGTEPLREGGGGVLARVRWRAKAPSPFWAKGGR